MSQIGETSPAGRTQIPKYRLDTAVTDLVLGTLRYARAKAACSKGQLVAPNLFGTISTGITAAADTNTFESSVTTFIPTDDADYDYDYPSVGSLLHVISGDGKEQVARVVNVLTRNKLVVDVIGTSDGTWGTTLGSTDNVRIIEPVVAPYDTDTHTLKPFGYAIEDVAINEYGFFGAVGQYPCSANTTVLGTRLIPGPTAGQVEPAMLYGTQTWDPGVLSHTAMLSTTLPVTGAETKDFVVVSLTSLATAGIQLTGHVSASDTVMALLHNLSGANVDLASGTLAAKVMKSIIPAWDCGVLISPPATAGELGIVDVNLLSSLQGNWYF